MVLTKSRSCRKARLRLRFRFGHRLSWALRLSGALITGGCDQRRIAPARESTAAYVGAATLLKRKKDGGDSASYHSDQASEFIKGVRFHTGHDCLLDAKKLMHTVCETHRYRCEAAWATRIVALPLLSIVIGPQRLLDCIELLALLY